MSGDSPNRFVYDSHYSHTRRNKPYERKYRGMQHQPQMQPQPQQQAQQINMSFNGTNGISLPAMQQYAAPLPQHSASTVDPCFGDLLERLQLNSSFQNVSSPLYDTTLLSLLTPDAVPPSSFGRFPYIPRQYSVNPLEPIPGSIHTGLYPRSEVGIGCNGAFNPYLFPTTSSFLEQKALMEQNQFLTQKQRDLEVATGFSPVLNQLDHNQLSDNRSQSFSSGFGSQGSSYSQGSTSKSSSPYAFPLPSAARSICDISPPLYIQQQPQNFFYCSNPPSGGLSYQQGSIHDNESLPSLSGKTGINYTQYAEYDKIRNTKIRGYSRRIYFNGTDYVFDNDEMPPPGEKRIYMLLSDNALNAEKNIKPALPVSTPCMQNNGDLFRHPKDATSTSSSLTAAYNHQESIGGAGDNAMIQPNNLNELYTFPLSPKLPYALSMTENHNKELQNCETLLEYDSVKEWPPLPQPQLRSSSSDLENVAGISAVGAKIPKSKDSKQQNKVGQKNRRKNWRSLNLDQS